MILLNSNLSAFLAVVENSTVSAAAKKLGITQTGATQRIKTLERELGAALFLRSRSGMTLTPEGTTLLRNCMQVRDLEGKLASELKGNGFHQEVEVSITGPGGVMARRVIPQCAEVRARWPRLNFHFISEALLDRIRLLKRGKADFAIVTPSEVKNEMDSKLIAPNEMVLVASRSWKGRDIEDILESERMIAYHSDDSLGLDYLKEFGLLDQLRLPKILANDNEMVLSLVRKGMGFALLSKELVTSYLDKGELITLNDGKPMDIRFALTWYPRSEMPGYFQELISAIK